VAAASTGITLSSNNHNFGSVTDGTSVAFSTTLTNNTGSTATFSFSNSAGAGYTTSTSCGTTLAASATCTYYFTFAPTSPGASTDTLTITSSVPILPGGMGSGPYTGTVTVSGTGVAGGTSDGHQRHPQLGRPCGRNVRRQLRTGDHQQHQLRGNAQLQRTDRRFLRLHAGGQQLRRKSLAVNANCELIFSFTPTATGFVTGRTRSPRPRRSTSTAAR
jgi:hypothetical protein